MGIENPGQPIEKTPEQIEDREKMRNRVDNLRKTDEEKDDSVYELAKTEHDFRERMGVAGVASGFADELADRHSDEALKRIEAEKKALVDPLTHLMNRRAFDEQGKEFLNAERRKEKKDCIVMLVDIDDFKKVNEEFGYQIGDKILKKVAETLKKNIRITDFLYRYGGEEFLIIFPNTDQKSGELLAEKIRRAVSEAFIEINHTKLHKTASMGAADLGNLPGINILEDDEATAKIISSANEALHFSKINGKDQVNIWSPTK